MGRFAAGLLATFVVGVAVLLGTAAPASAHASLTRTDPSSGAILQSAPASITLSFTEGVRPVAERIQVIGPDKARADSGTPRVNGTDLSIPLARNLGKGTYLVTFRVISADSHPIGGSFTFSIGQPSANAPTADTSVGERADPVVAGALGVARWLGYAGLVLIAGPLIFLARLWPRRLSRTVPARLLAAGLGVTTLATVAEMYLQGPYSAGNGIFDVSSTALEDALSGSFGAAHAVRLGVLAAVSVLIRPFLRPEPPSTVDQAVLAFLAVVGIGTWPLSGHPAASPVPAVSMVADAAHVGAMAVWMGGLLLLILVVLRRANATELGAILPVWSQWAMLCVITLTITGTASAIIEVSEFGKLFDSTYGKLVLGKAALLAVIVGIAYFSRRLVLRFAAASVPPDDDDEDVADVEEAEPPARPLRRLILVELAITGVVLGLAAALVQTPPARTANAAVPGPYTVTLTSDKSLVRVELEPAKVGGNSMHLYAYTRTGTPQSVVEWKASITPTSGSVEPIEIPILPITPDHSVGEPIFPDPGEYELKITVRISDIDQSTLSARLTVR
ncbi:copper resistance CopC/CopD family protein [Virgisporangium aliadipatigenens]